MKPDPRADRPARRIQKRGDMKTANVLSGFKAPGVVQTESALQSTACLAADLDPRIVRWRVEPFCVDLLSGESAADRTSLIARFSNGRYRPEIYTPDLQLFLTDGSDRIIECKATYWIGRDPDRMARLLSVMPQLGFRYVLLTQRHLSRVFAHNVKLLHPYLSRQCSRLQDIVSFCALPVSFGPVLSGLNVEQADILASIAHGHHYCNFKLQRLSRSSVLQTDDGRRSFLKGMPL